MVGEGKRYGILNVVTAGSNHIKAYKHTITQTHTWYQIAPLKVIFRRGWSMALYSTEGSFGPCLRWYACRG